jgi:hypothetical protein
MKLNNSFFCITPKTFQAIDVNLATAKSFSMINSEMPIATKHQGVITSEFIGIDDRASSNSPDRQIENSLCTHILEDLYLHKPLSLQNAKNRDFVSSSPATLPLPSTSKVSFICLNFTFQEKIAISSVSCDRLPDKVKGLKNRRVRETQLLRSLLNPSSCKIRKLITTTIDKDADRSEMLVKEHILIALNRFVQFLESKGGLINKGQKVL